MHELPITQSLLEIALQHGERAGAERITQLDIVVGDLSSVVDDSVQFYWDIVSKGTIAEGADLCFRRVPGTLRCVACGETFTFGRMEYVCPNCGSGQVVVVGGDEFRLESIEID